MAVTSIPQACDIVIFGAKGDLTRRKLFPAFYQLEKAGALHPETRIIGVGRIDWEVQVYTKAVREALDVFMQESIDEELWKTFSARLGFCNLDVNDTKHFSSLGKKLDQKARVTVYYFAMPSSTFGAICKGLGAAGLNSEPSRVVIEKPLGRNLASSKVINDQVMAYFKESQVYRIDHYLGKDTVLNLLALRFANSLFAFNWDNRTIDHVQITVAEQIGIEGRWDYFDQAGQMRDMIQSHALQILSMIGMSPPSDLTTDSVRDEKVKVLRSLRLIDRKNVAKNTVRGQYISGFIQEKRVPGYLEEEGANKNSRTETFVAIRVDIDNWRWAGVPFYLRTGKRLLKKYSEVVIVFKNLDFNLFRNSYQKLPQNKLTIRLQPDEGMEIQILNRVPGLDYERYLQITKLDLSYMNSFKQKNLVDAYERLLLEVMRGTQALFVRRDEVEAAWRWVDAIIEGWEAENNLPQAYEAGTCGPLASVSMMTRDSRSWSWYE